MGVGGAAGTDAKGGKSRAKIGEHRHGRPRRGCVGAYTRQRSLPPVPEPYLYPGEAAVQFSKDELYIKQMIYKLSGQFIYKLTS